MRILGGGAAAAAAVLVLAGCGGGGPSKPPSFTVKGAAVYPTGQGCDGVFSEGMRVTVLDAKGKKVGLGSLGHGQDQQIACRFPFKVTGVPGGDNVYSVQLGSDPKTYDFKRSEASNVVIGVGID
jgi:hypothetical protein